MSFKVQNLLNRKSFCYSKGFANLFRVGICFPVLVFSACSSGGNESGYNKPNLVENNTSNTPSRQIGILLPLTGRNGELGNNMLKAAQLALNDPSSPPVDIRDTASEGGAIAAAQQAVAAGDGIILGPLTGSETADITAVTTAANIPVLAYTSDVKRAQATVWVMGITPEQQVDAMVRAAKAEGRSRFAAFLPDTPLGHAMADGLIRSCDSMGLVIPKIVFHTQAVEDINQKLKELSDYDNRTHQSNSAQANINPSNTKSDGNSADSLINELVPTESTVQKTDSPKGILPPPPFDALLLADTGLQLQTVMNALDDNQISSKQVQIMGPGLWAAFASKLGKLQGAWYAAPDPQKRQGFVQQYMVKYNQMPKPLSDLAYDSAALVRNLDKMGGYKQSVLTRKEGFDGVDGPFKLSANGHVVRSLKLFEIQQTGGGKMMVPSSSKPNVGS